MAAEEQPRLTTNAPKSSVRISDYKWESPVLKEPLTISEIMEETNSAQYLIGDYNCIYSKRIVYFRVGELARDKDACVSLASFYVRLAATKLKELGLSVTEETFLFDINIPLKGGKEPKSIFLLFPTDARVANLLLGCEPNGKPRRIEVESLDPKQEGAWVDEVTGKVMITKPLPSHIPFAKISLSQEVVHSLLVEISAEKGKQITTVKEAGILTRIDISFYVYLEPKIDYLVYNIIFSQFHEGSDWISDEAVRQRFAKYNTSKEMAKVRIGDQMVNRLKYPIVTRKKTKSGIDNLFVEFDPNTNDAFDAKGMCMYCSFSRKRTLPSGREDVQKALLRFTFSKLSNEAFSQSYNRNVYDESSGYNNGGGRGRGGSRGRGASEGRGRGGFGRFRKEY